MSLSVPISIGDIDNHSSSNSSSTRTSVNLDNLTLEETLNYSVLPVTRNNYSYAIKRMERTFGKLTKNKMLRLNVIKVQKYLLSFKQTTKVLTSTIDKFRSALRLHFVDADIFDTWMAKWDKPMARMVASMRRVEGLQKRNGNSDYSGRGTGKKKVPHTFHVWLCEYILKYKGDPYHLQALAYLQLLWNLACRSDNVECLSWKYSSVANDHVEFRYATTKTDPDSANAADPRAVYSNPTNIYCDTYIALGLFLATSPDLDAMFIFPGTKQNDRFGKFLKKLSKEAPVVAKLDGLGLTWSDLGLHSWRKGASSYMTGSSTAGPNIVAVCLRCGWSLGDVLRSYLKYGNAADEYCGRTLAGLPINDKSFGVLPPHHLNGSNDNMKKALDKMWPNRKTYQTGILKVCISSLVYHHETLSNMLPISHPIFSCGLYADEVLLSQLKADVKIGFVSDEMSGTGIPPHISILHGMADLRTDFANFRTEMLEQQKKCFEENSIAAGNVTFTQMQTLMNVNREADREFLRQMLLSNGIGNAAPAITTLDNRSKVYAYGGKLGHKIPQNYTLPTFKPLPAWQLWHCGNAHIRPFKLLVGSDFNSVAEAKKFSEYSVCMIVFENILEKVKPDMVRENPTDIQIGKSFEVIIREIRSRIPIYNRVDANRTRKRRDQAITTYMKHIRANKELFPEYIKHH